MRPPKGRTWGRRGQTPVVRVPAGGSQRISIAALICHRPGFRPRLIYRTLTHRNRKNEAKSFTSRDYARLADAAHQQLDGPIVLVWDSLNTHTTALMRRLVADRPWLRVFQLPTYAPELNPVEGVWSHLKRSLANLVKVTIDQLTTLVKTRLKRIQHHPTLLTGLLTKTGLDLKPP